MNNTQYFVQINAQLKAAKADMQTLRFKGKEKVEPTQEALNCQLVTLAATSGSATCHLLRAELILERLRELVESALDRIPAAVAVIIIEGYKEMGGKINSLLDELREIVDGFQHKLA